jgi:hypothetical protein
LQCYQIFKNAAFSLFFSPQILAENKGRSSYLPLSRWLLLPHPAAGLYRRAAHAIVAVVVIVIQRHQAAAGGAGANYGLLLLLLMMMMVVVGRMMLIMLKRGRGRLLLLRLW